jgi:nucleoside-diphosphate-sugar epimerase
MHRNPTMAWSGDATTQAVGVLGGTSFVGQRLLTRLEQFGLQRPGSPAAVRRLVAFSRSARPAAATDTPGVVQWHGLPVDHATWGEAITHWIAACPLWAVPEHLPLLEAAGARRLVALSSTSRFTKRSSPVSAERALAARLAAAEEDVLGGARARGIVTTIFRPTMIYDGIHDRNVTAIADFIRRFGFFPVAGGATGLRQPVHADDVATACLRALACDGPRDEAYALSGAETLSYREMVLRIFAWLDRPARVATIPAGLVRAVAPLLGRLPGLGSLPAMAARMNDDLVFDHGAASRDFGFQPRPFTLPLQRSPNHAAGTPDHGSSP